jgi:hypothetical protein
MLGTIGGVVFASPGGTTISNVLTTDVNATAEAGSLAMTWGLGTGSEGITPPVSYVNTDLDLSMTVGTPIYLWVQTVNTKAYSIDKVLFLVETANKFNIRYYGSAPETLEWHGPLTYGTPFAGCYYYGPVTGFSMPGSYTATTRFEITANAAGSFTAKVYAVQLD